MKGKPGQPIKVTCILRNRLVTGDNKCDQSICLYINISSVHGKLKKYIHINHIYINANETFFLHSKKL